jgi:hypothetical protein
MARDKGQESDIFMSQRGKRKLAHREIDASIRAQLVSVGSSLRDFHSHFSLVDETNDAADLAIVKPDRFSRANVVEDLRQSNTDTSGPK